MIASARVEIDEHNYEVTVECDRSIEPTLAVKIASDALMELVDPERA